jgi:FecR protein
MRKTFILAALVCLTFSLGLFAQTTPTSISDMYLISSKAGKVNLVEGAVLVELNGGKNTGLNKSDELKIGEKVSTGSNGKAEILLNPGSYLRLGENSEFEFVTTGLDDLQLKLNRGSAIFEVLTNSEQGFVVGIQTPQTKTFILESGVYRIDVLADNSTKVSVWKGKAQIGEKNAQFIKGGKSATVKNSLVAVAKFDRDNKDALDNWSKLRAKDLMAINAKLRDANLRNSLLRSFSNRGWNAFESYGVWVYNRFSGTWCFLPFGRSWDSPYGWGYGSNIWHCNMPTIVMYTPPSVIQGYMGERTGRNPRDPRETPPASGNADESARTKPVERDRPVFENPRGSSSSDTGSRFEPSYNPPTGNRDTPVNNPPTGSRDTPVYNPPSPSADTGAKVKDN